MSRWKVRWIYLLEDFVWLYFYPPVFFEQLTEVNALRHQDLAKGFGEVYLPDALVRKYPNAAKNWAWQYVFPSSKLSLDPRSGIVRRPHMDETSIQKAVGTATRKANIAKQVSAHTLRHYAEFRTMPRVGLLGLSIRGLAISHSA